MFMKIGIVGAGAMGSLFAWLLVRSGQDVSLLDVNRELVDKVKKDGLKIEGISGNHTVPIKIAGDPVDLEKFDLAIIFVKSYDTEVAVKGALSLFGLHTTILTLQNGLGNIEKIARVAGEKRVLGGTTSQGATVLGRGWINYAGSGDTVIGELSGEITGRVKKVAKIFNQADIKTEITGDLTGLIWNKLLINVGINALTALTRLKNGQLLDYPETEEILRMTVEEAVMVGRAKGIQIMDENPVKKVESVCEATSANVSSMLQDIMKGKKTEIEDINGAVVFEGRKLKVPTPANAVLTNLVKIFGKTKIIEV